MTLMRTRPAEQLFQAVRWNNPAGNHRHPFTTGWALSHTSQSPAPAQRFEEDPHFPLILR